jgi:hypothetical protein
MKQHHHGSVLEQVVQVLIGSWSNVVDAAPIIVTLLMNPPSDIGRVKSISLPGVDGRS